ncbi:phosphoribosylaminoimidazolesuccinocarboxamide synthase [Helicobacter monodelphidis]|uniref:phosphoribosylaminoimidazolesuccinocarboxamide synthase n=1 Tax=Helicobacter sp. 15-1451 TaxID=2004995 RepID=UPI000DCD468F|nr:phosphoribosylaminoimidazolesuccinocarboxamide synthase [Helicobacter sp. 15-1451]RAX56881.1 phosphoribosylaminoimidazolesuccinocarboxamide synthase [Helicobacter sp. 15-1451]
MLEEELDSQELLYEGKGKKLYRGSQEEEVIAYFKDDLTAFNAEKKGQEKGKGILNCQISSILFELLETHGIQTHFIRKLGDNCMVCKRVNIIPIEVVVRNVATGSLTKRLGIKEGTILPQALVEFYYKDDALSDPIINDEHAILLGCVSHTRDLEFLRLQARKVNQVLVGFFNKRDLRLIDFKLEFGKDKADKIILADEISPDSCRFWDKTSNEKLDKDRFRQDLGGVKLAYEEVLKRITTIK